MQNIRRHGHDPCDLEADVRSQDPCDLEAKPRSMRFGSQAKIRAIWKHTRHAMKLSLGRRTGQSASAVSCRTTTKVNVRDFTHVEYISSY